MTRPGVLSVRMQIVAPKRKPKTLLEVNVLLAARTFLTEEQLANPRRLPLIEQARIMVKAMPKATRVGEFIALWAIAKNQNGVVTMENLAEMWDEPLRTMYRRLEEFREVWDFPGYDTPDTLADYLIADYRKRRETLSMRHVAKLLSASVPPPADLLSWGSP